MIKILEYSDLNLGEILKRSEIKTNVSSVVSEIIEDVKKNGDTALFKYAEKFDGVKLKNLKVSEEEIEEAYNSVEEEFKIILKKAAENITRFHKKQLRTGFLIERGGTVIGQRVSPLKRAGLYVPGGTAAYPSTVLMDAIPAVVAGVKEVVMVTPPAKNGSVNPVILAAAKVAGVKEIYKVGGAQAIAALAYGTESIKKVDKIVGPGNAFVAEAKRQVFGRVSIDMIAGPSEILIIADKDNDPEFLAADLLSQAEHDKMATAVLITDDESLAKKVAEAIERQLKELQREEIARTSIEENGKIIIVKDIDEAINLSNELAPEHLELCIKYAKEKLDKVENAGSVFMGKYCPEALGDYFIGMNHTLPTSGTAKFSSPLSVDDFIKKTQFAYYDKHEYEKIAKDVEFFANKEGLTAHAKSAVIRLKDE